MMRRWSMLLFGAALLFASQPVAGSETPDPDIYLYEVLINKDSNDATGCDADAEDDNFTGPVPGIEFILQGLVLRYPTQAVVEEVRLIKCDGGTLQFDQTISNGDWMAGLENGINNADVVEVSVPRMAIGDPPSMTLGFHSTRNFLNDVLLTTNGQNDGEQILFVPTPREGVPLLSSQGVGIVVLLLLSVGWLSLRRFRQAPAVLTAMVLVASFAVTAWALTIMLDGDVTDWQGVSPIAMDQIKDSTADDPAEDFVAAFAGSDSMNLYFRMDVVNLAPVVCGNGVVESGEECEYDGDCNDFWESANPGSGGGAAIEFECDDCRCVPD